MALLMFRQSGPIQMNRIYINCRPRLAGRRAAPGRAEQIAAGSSAGRFELAAIGRGAEGARESSFVSNIILISSR
jgi:hypothetical protein